MKIAVLGPGGVGGLVAGALTRQRAPQAGAGRGDGEGAPDGARVVLLARESTALAIGRRGLRVSSVVLGDFTSHPRTGTELGEPVDALIVATKAAGLVEALARVRAQPGLVLPLLNGLDHLATLRERFGEETVVAGTIRVEADRPAPGVVVHTSRFLRIDMASRHRSMQAPMQRLAGVLSEAGVPARVYRSEESQRAAEDGSAPSGARLFDSSIAPRGQIGDGQRPASRATPADGGEAQVMWSKLVRLNALACTTSAHDLPLGPIRSTPELRAELVGAIREGCAVADAEGADVPAADPLGELNAAHDTLGSSMQRDIAAGRPPELDAIPGAVLRAADRHGIECPTIERLVATIAERAQVPRPKRVPR